MRVGPVGGGSLKITPAMAHEWVETMQNVVQLSGFVDSAQTKARAGELAGSVTGVREVKNDLVVR